MVYKMYRINRQNIDRVNILFTKLCQGSGRGLILDPLKSLWPNRLLGIMCREIDLLLLSSNDPVWLRLYLTLFGFT